MPPNYSLPEPIDPEARRLLESDLRHFYELQQVCLDQHDPMPFTVQIRELFSIFSKHAPLETARQRMNAELALADLKHSSTRDGVLHHPDVNPDDLLTEQNAAYLIQLESDLIRHKYKRFLEADDEADAEQQLREKHPGLDDRLEDSFREAQWRRPDAKLPPGEEP